MPRNDKTRPDSEPAPADPVIPDRSADDSDVGWHERADDSSNDERLRRDVPPHW